MLREGQPVLICVADSLALEAVPEVHSAAERSEQVADILKNGIATGQSGTAHTQVTPFLDAIVAQKVSNWITSNRIDARLRPASEFSMHDLRMSPAVLVGSLDNPWTLRLLSKLRYSVQTDVSGDEVWIQDAKNPTRRDMVLNTSTSYRKDPLSTTDSLRVTSTTKQAVEYSQLAALVKMAWL